MHARTHALTANDNTPRGNILLFVVFLLLAPAAHAGIADSPLPVLVAGETTYHLYSVPFVARPGGGVMETIFACTSTDTVPMQVCVESFDVFGSAFNLCSTSSLSVAPGQNVRFGTASTVAISVNSTVGGSTTGGSVRILATSKKLVCTVFLVDGINNPPTSMVHLTIIKKKTQKGD